MGFLSWMKLWRLRELKEIIQGHGPNERTETPTPLGNSSP